MTTETIDLAFRQNRLRIDWMHAALDRQAALPAARVDAPQLASQWVAVRTIVPIGSRCTASAA